MYEKQTSSLINTISNKNNKSTPIWLMRQAGRYLPEYREVRSGVTFLEMCADVERAVEVSLQPIDLVGSEVVILFSDIFIPILGMGVDLEFTPVPKIS